MRTFSQRLVSMLVLLMAVAVLMLAPQPAAACTGECRLSGCVDAGYYTGMLCSDLGGGCIETQCVAAVSGAGEAAPISKPFTIELAPLTPAKPAHPTAASPVCPAPSQ